MAKPENRYEAALGCLLGACVGDAAGATLEFLGRTPNLSEVDDAMTMPGGGVWDLAPGQITDDGELTLSLAQALASSHGFLRDRIAQNYAAWMESNPFDCGMTTSQAFSSIQYPGWQTEFETLNMADIMQFVAAKYSLDSKANGSLMRISPLGVWGYQRDNLVLANYAQQDSLLSHANESCCQSVACYTLAIASLMQDLGNREVAFEQVQHWATVYANSEVRNWLDAAQQNFNQPYHPQSGFIKIAFIHAFRHLILGTPYKEAIRETLSGGGDTDTNACIVGGLIGAAEGAHTIPHEMKDPVLSCDTQQGSHPRPDFLHPAQLADLAKQLLEKGDC